MYEDMLQATLRFLDDHGVRYFTHGHNPTGFMVSTKMATVRKHDDQDYEVRVFDQGEKECRYFKDFWETLAFLKDLES